MQTIALRLAIIGCGTMGEAIVSGLLRAQAIAPEQLIVTTRRQEVAETLSRRYGIHATTDNVAACSGADAVLFALKPKTVPKVADQADMREALAGKPTISIAAGVKLDDLRAWLPQSLVIRAMPNTPCLIGEGTTVLSRSADVSDQAIALATRIFETVGLCVELQERHMDAVTGLCGSGPAFVYVMLESMADGGVMMGLPREVALQIAAQVFQGAARMVLQTGLHPAALKDQVTTPAGCTIAGILMMEDGRIRSVLARTVQEAARVAGGLGDPDELERLARLAGDKPS
ncbi:MAG TPA: pyrroline-5-carboxylate reductase [Nannocystis exedens]|nr:pyrroline-5-carboxylate reductase [Nannocystis exedens]